jgi:hypothetical protein
VGGEATANVWMSNGRLLLAEFDFEAGEERVIEIAPGTYSYVISSPCIMGLRDRDEFPAAC